ncbi:MAG: DNA methylase [Eubacteriaceae bacterium]|nr:DNA methylase [Eubacteriaceae bacterium]
MKERTYIAIDLKSFYASVECMDRGLDPLKTNLVVADGSRTDKTICLAVSPSLKSYGISGRARLFEVVSSVKQVNAMRAAASPGGYLSGESFDADELKRNPNLAVSYIVAPPRMANYMKCSTDICNIYLKYIAPEDIHVYSIDEVFMDVTGYLNTYKMTAHQLAMTIIQDVLKTTGITATAGIGTNLYLCKIAMDIVAKHAEPDKDGVRIAQLDEMSYRRLLWNHRPLTDFWRVGKGIAKKLEANGLYTMGDVARCSIGKKTDYHNEDLLYKLFGVNAELLIDHAWGWEPCTLKDIRGYKPQSSSVSSGQVLMEPYDAEKTRLIVKEMTELMTLDLVRKGLVTDQITLTIGYDIENLTRPEIRAKYNGPVTVDSYGRKVPKHAHGTGNLGRMTASTKIIMEAMMDIYDRIINKELLVRRVTLTANNLIPEGQAEKQEKVEQLNLFSDFTVTQQGVDYRSAEKRKQDEEAALELEKKAQQAILDIKAKFGKNAVLKGMNLEEGGTTISRNKQIGGHKE